MRSPAHCTNRAHAALMDILIYSPCQVPHNNLKICKLFTETSELSQLSSVVRDERVFSAVYIEVEQEDLRSLRKKSFSREDNDRT